jgi:PAS domain S-box-containing protein
VPGPPNRNGNGLAEQLLLAEKLADITLALTSHRETPRILDEILRQAERLVPYDSANIALLEDGVLRLVRWRGYDAGGDTSRLAGLRQPLADLPLERQALLHNEPAFLAGQAYQGWLGGGDVIRSLLVMPLQVRGQPLGVLRLDAAAPDHFTRADAARLLPVVNAAAIALENAQLLETSQQRAAEHEVIRELGLLMSASLQSEKVFQAILQAVFTLLPDLRNAHIFVCRGDQLAFAAARWGDGREGPAFTPRPEGITHTVARTGQAIAVADMQDHPLYRDAPPGWNGRIMGLPLTSDEKVVGVMNVSGAEPRPWTGKERYTLELLAGQAAIAIRNAHLYEEARRQLAERQRAEEAYHNLVNSSPVGLLLLHEESIAFANPTLVEILGRSPQELQSMSMGELLRACVHPDDRRELVRVVRQQMAAGSEPARHELRVRHRDGSERFLSGYIAHTHYAGRPAVQIVSLDVTEQRRTAARLRQLSQAVEQSPASIVITDAQGTIEYVNPRFTQVSGYMLEEAVGRNPRFLKSDLMGPEEYRQLWQTISSGQAWRGEFCNLRKDGEPYWESAVISPIINDAGEITHYLAVKEDITEQKAAEEALRASQQLLESTFNSLQDAVLIVDAARDAILDCNPATETVFGYSRAELLGSSFARLHVSELRAAAYRRRVQAATLGHGHPRRVEIQMRRSDGSRFPTEMTTAPLFDAGGGQTGWMTVVRDISERKQQELAIQRRNIGLEFINAITSAINRPATLQQVIQVALNEVLQRLSVDGAEILLATGDGEMSRAAQRGLDELPPDGAGSAAWQALRRPRLLTDLPGNPASAAAYEAGFRLLLAVPLLSRDELRGVLLLYWRDQTAFAAEMEQVLFIAGGQLAAAVERARLFEAERAQRLHMEALQSAAATINSSLDLPVVLERLLIALGQVIPYDTASVILRDGDEWRVYAGHGLPPGVAGVWAFPDDDPLTARMAATGQPLILADAREEPSFRTADGAIVVRGWMGVPLIVRDRMIGYLTLDSHVAGAYGAQDAAYAMGFAQQAATAVENARLHADLRAQLEALAAAQTRLVQSEKLAAIGELVAGVAHELNNPLGAVMLYAQLLQQKGAAPAMQRDLDRIVEQAQRASNIVQSLLDFARQRAPVRKPVQTEELVHNSLALIRYELTTHNVTSQVEVVGDIPATMADPHQIQQVLVNLFNNAYQAMSKAHGGGTLVVTLSHGPSLYLGEPGATPVVRVAIADSGPGIDPGLLARIFDPFFTTKEPGDGTGLGLSVAHGIVSEHKGAIWAESETGQGSTFFVELPLLAPPEPLQVEALLQPSPAPPARLLVIDDEPAVRETLARVLEDSGYQVDTVADGSAALERLRLRAYDLILCDMRMPGLSGPAFYEAVLAYDPAVAARILFSTGDVVSAATRKFLDTYAVPVLAKPFTIEMLLQAVEERLGTK